MPPEVAMQRIDDLVSHVWMVRAFIKHCEEVEEDDELASVHRDLYDFAHALGPPLKAGDAAAYVKAVKKKFSKLNNASQLFSEIQPEISDHTNFQMAERSLRIAVGEIAAALQEIATDTHG